MDFSLLKDAMASKSYAKIADICDELMLQAILLLSSSSFDWVVICISFLTSFCYLEEIEQVVSQGIAFQDDWPYTIHLLGHIYVDDVNSARFLWKSIPSSIKESQPEVLAAWRIGQRLWMRDYAGVHEALRGFDWSLEVQDNKKSIMDEIGLIDAKEEPGLILEANTGKRGQLKMDFQELLSLEEIKCNTRFFHEIDVEI
ncbi:hypothetical protein HHK36_008007 [Tetracentron sinense]|uniref:CSN8/PSMD8/EIF3K domain-containing protein n=1 Tax=Tetracentron sinense TaxID=13715 RepID=A0A834ZES7_TETSI|nr:hypothetical protein HHK36_008007 [Tetracentron sinense]